MNSLRVKHTDEFQQFRRRFQLSISLGGAGFMSIKETRKAAFVGSFALAAHHIAWWRLVFANLKFYPTGRPTANPQSTSRGSRRIPFSSWMTLIQPQCFKLHSTSYNTTSAKERIRGYQDRE
jgi:hypothetical protein